MQSSTQTSISVHGSDWPPNEIPLKVSNVDFYLWTSTWLKGPDIADERPVVALVSHFREDRRMQTTGPYIWHTNKMARDGLLQQG